MIGADRIKLISRLKQYLIKRFISNNHPKYHKYCMSWINNLTIDQLLYFDKEKEHLENNIILK